MLRNFLFDHGLLEQRKAPYPVISVGNLAVGGTGKTPMVEYLIRLTLNAGLYPIVISRGYRRRTKGPLLATLESTADDIGDEPLQIFRKFQGRVPVIVSEDRRRALPLLSAAIANQKPTAANQAPTTANQNPATTLQDSAATNQNPTATNQNPATATQASQQEGLQPVLILDDAFQHRYLQRDCNILLTDYHRLYTRDHPLPFGRLRERRRGARRADIIIVTKCPADLAHVEAEDLLDEIAPTASQHIFFSTIAYDDLPPEVRSAGHASLVTGIANPRPLAAHLAEQGIKVIKHLRYPDHHRFSPANLTDIQSLTPPILTTEKDAARLPSNIPVAPLAIHPEILFNEAQALNNLILNYVS